MFFAHAVQCEATVQFDLHWPGYTTADNSPAATRWWRCRLPGIRKPSRTRNHAEKPSTLPIHPQLRLRSISNGGKMRDEHHATTDQSPILCIYSRYDQQSVVPPPPPPTYPRPIYFQHVQRPASGNTQCSLLIYRPPVDQYELPHQSYTLASASSLARVSGIDFSELQSWPITTPASIQQQ